MASELIDRFARVRRDTPDKVLVHNLTDQRTQTSAQLWDEFEAVRGALIGAGLVDENLLVAMTGNRGSSVTLLMACLDLRIPIMPVDRGTALPEVLDLVDRWSASALVLAEPPPAFSHPPHVVLPLPNDLYLVRFPDMRPHPEQYIGAALLKLTSGSSGQPKATRTTERHLCEDVDHIVEAMEIRPEDMQLGAIPLSHAYGLGNLVLPLLTQGTAIAIRDGFAPKQFEADVHRLGISVFPGVPFMFEHLLPFVPPERWPKSLGLLISAGARLELRTQHAFKEQFNVKIHSFYGASETGGICYDDSEEISTVLTVGRMMPGVTVKLLKGDIGSPPNGGRVHVTSSAVADGYAGLPDSRQEGFIHGGFLTGDLGYFVGHRDLRHLVLTGRVSEFINVAGRKVHPVEVERALRQMPEVADVRVMGAPCPKRGQIIVACIVPRSSALTPGIVRQYCVLRLAAYKIPREFLFLERFPQDERGKTNRRALEEAIAVHLSDR